LSSLLKEKNELNVQSRQLVISFPKDQGPEVKACLKQAADDEGRSVSNMTFRIIREWLDNNGYGSDQVSSHTGTSGGF